MRKAIFAVAAIAALAGMPSGVGAQESTIGGALIGAGTGAVIGGAVGGGRGAAVGAVVGGTTGAAIGASAEPRYHRGYRHRHCWHNRFGELRCRYD